MSAPALCRLGLMPIRKYPHGGAVCDPSGSEDPGENNGAGALLVFSGAVLRESCAADIILRHKAGASSGGGERNS